MPGKPSPTCDLGELAKIIEVARVAAIRYRHLTGKPLGVTAEIAEYEAARLMKVDLCAARQPGYDAVGNRAGRQIRIQIKARVILPTSKRAQRVPSIKLTHPWDVVWLILLNESYKPLAIWEANRFAIQVAAFKSIGKQVWSVRTGDRS